MRDVYENVYPTSYDVPHDWFELYDRCEWLLGDNWKSADPLLLLATGYGAYHTANFDRASALIRRAIAQFRLLDYPHRVIVSAHQVNQDVAILGKLRQSIIGCYTICAPRRTNTDSFTTLFARI